MRSRLVVAAFTLALCACEHDPTQLVVVVDTDMVVPEELTGFTTRIGPAREQASDERTFWLDDREGSVALAASFGVAPRGGDDERRVRIEVEALGPAGPLFETHAVTGFVEDEALRLDMFLADLCKDLPEPCPEGQRCTRDGCVPEFVDPGDLPEWSGLAEDDDGGTQERDEWVILAGEGDLIRVVDAAASARGDVYLLVTLSAGGVLDVDGVTLDASEEAFAVLGISRDQSFLWAPELVEAAPAGSAMRARAIAVDGRDRVWVVGTCTGTPDFGDGPVDDEGRQLFAVRYDGSSGAWDWASVEPYAAEGEPVDVVATDEGVAVAAWFMGTYRTAGGGEAIADDPQTVVWLVDASDQLECEWIGSSPLANRPYALVHDPSTGELLVAGTFEGSFRVDENTLVALHDHDGYLVGLRDCAIGMSAAIPQLVDDTHVIRIDETGAFIAATLDPGDGSDVYVARVSETGLEESTHGGSPSTDVIAAMTAVAGVTTIAVAGGSFTGDGTFDGESLTVAGQRDSFLLGFSATEIAWVDEMDGTPYVDLQALASPPGSSIVYVAGVFESELSVGNPTLSTERPNGIFLLRKDVNP